jgi:subtilase family serine protease
VALFIGDQVINQDAVKALAPGEIAQGEFAQMEMPQTFEVRLCTDTDNAMVESDENNNCVGYGT